MADKNDDTVTKTDHDTAVTAAETQGKTEGASAERKRFGAVMSSEHYPGREAQATKMLTTTDLSAEQINDILAEAPKAVIETKADDEDEDGDDKKKKGDDGKEKADGKNHFKEHMDANGGPEVGAGDAGEDADQNTPEANASRIMAAYNAATGKPAKKD